MTNNVSQPHPYSKVLTVSSYLFAVIGVLAGIGVLVFLFSNEESRKDLKIALMSPFLLGGAGYIFGMSLAFLFAPVSFITGESGKKWMDMVGTKSVVAARAVCAVVALLTAALFGILPWAAATGNF
jgi:hypothetical protein